jgi:hypothetical protein
MKRKIILIAIILGSFYGCITPKYYVMKYSQIQSLDLDKSLVNYIPLEDELVVKSVVLDSTYNLLINKKYMTLENYVRNLEKSGAKSSDLSMAITLSEITQQHYPNALNRLEMIQDNKYALLKTLLTIDLKYENERQEGGFDFKKYLQKYQTLIDNYPDNQVLKKIVSLRLRYLRYNY